MGVSPHEEEAGREFPLQEHHQQEEEPVQQETASAPGSVEPPVRGNDPKRERVLQLFREQYVRKLLVERRRIADAIFLTIEQIRRELLTLAQHEDMRWLHDSIAVPLHIDEERHHDSVNVPYIPVLCLAAASRMALNWHVRPVEGEEKLRRDTLERLLCEVGPHQSAEEITKTAPDVGAILDVLIGEVVHRTGNMAFLTHGIDQDFIKDHSSDFFVRAKMNPVEQTQAIAEGLLQRLQYLFSEESMQRLDEMRWWKQWLPQVVPARPEHLPMLQDIYDAVKIHPKLLEAMVSPSAGKKERAIELVERDVGFLHARDDEALGEMIARGITAIVPNLAYFSVVADTEIVKALLAEYCGFDPAKEYHSIEDLPRYANKQSIDGQPCPLDWINKRYALEMLKDPEAVAFTIEMAVKDVAVDKGGKGPYRRGAGIATALKYTVYSQVEQPLIFTRYFEILSVNGISVPSAVNRATAYSIQALGGHHIGVAEETFVVNPDAKTPVTLTVLWHYCLAERDVALRRIAQRESK